ncbi:MAG: hypothetical protein GY841_23180 [FCB group bacterium]|nr:hypothetical protein [FCB group bacterium]
MIHDPIIEEIRKIRHEIEAECGNDADKYFQHIQEIQKKHKHLVRRQPKPRLQMKIPKLEDMTAPA